MAGALGRGKDLAVKRNKKKKKNPRGQAIAEEIIRKEGGKQIAPGKFDMTDAVEKEKKKGKK